MCVTIVAMNPFKYSEYDYIYDTVNLPILTAEKKIIMCGHFVTVWGRTIIRDKYYCVRKLCS